MKNSKQLGVSWESNSLYFAESTETDPKKVFHVPFESRTQTPTQEIPLDLWEKELAAKIKGALKKQKVTSTAVNLSLSTSDIIFRSFVIPWMQKNEVKNVVEFEACKYIPFSLKELSYSYHHIAIRESDLKQIRIIFVAIKNDALNNYVRVLEAASLNVNIIEPSALSLIRTLSFKELIPKDKTIALIEKADVGRIVVCDNNIPQFVREFHLSTESPEQGAGTPEDTMEKLTKEVRISIDYFKRQNEQLNIEKIFFLSSSSEEDLPRDLETDLDIPIAPIEISLVLSEASQLGIGALNAYGASLIPFVSSAASFNLSKNKSDYPQGVASPEKTLNYKSLIITALICVPLIVGSFVMSILWTNSVKKEIDTLTQKLGIFRDSDIANIKKKEELLKRKLINLQQTRLNSDATLFLLVIPDLLPDGTWLKTLDISYYDVIKRNKPSTGRRRLVRRVNTEVKPSLVITIDGYSFSKNKGEQFRLVNTLLGELKDKEEFSKFFQNIELVTINAQKLNENDVTYFKIVCKQANENIGSK